ncbi:hypothetical protein [Pseudomonas syringae]|uniref:hypothetical protein n=1 Tax=Pseudomonas syringae TaxID=317 RepID=UPI0002098DDB|nr:hypothetical protein [Pseudomonas syringae]MDP5168535.1 hypothetical protein [Pseudomonas syringae pv. aptata str. DSM 50252]
MGIPVIDVADTVTGSYSFAHMHPYLTAVIIFALLAMAYCMYRFLKGANKKQKFGLRLLIFVIYLAVTIPLLIAWFMPQPSWFERVEAATQQVLESQTK